MYLMYFERDDFIPEWLMTCLTNQPLHKVTKVCTMHDAYLSLFMLNCHSNLGQEDLINKPFQVLALNIA